jgi:hypothetical protein
MSDFLTGGDLSTVKAFLNFTKVSGADDTQIQLAVDMACSDVETACGPVLTATVTAELVEGSGSKLPLKYHAATLTSLATYPGGTAITVTDYRIDGQILARKDGGWITGPIAVTYTTGSALPTWAKAAALFRTRYYWRTQLGRPGGLEPSAEMGSRDLKISDGHMADHLLAPGGFA